MFGEFLIDFWHVALFGCINGHMWNLECAFFHGRRSVPRKMYRPLNGELGWTYIPIGLGNTSFPGTTDRARPAGRVEMSLNWAWPGNIAPCRPLKGIIRPHRNTVQVVTRCGLLLQTESRATVFLSVCLSRSWALQKPLNWSRCRLRWELGVDRLERAQGGMYYIHGPDPMITGNLTCNNSLPWVEQQIAQLSQRDRATI